MVFLFCMFCCSLSGNTIEDSRRVDFLRVHKENLHRISPDSLLRYRKWEYSQNGEDGIIAEIFKRMGIEKGFFVEFGAADGIRLSNTYSLYKKGWNGFYIEIEPCYKTQLEKNFPPSCGVDILIEKITWEKDDITGLMFDEIAKSHFPDRDIDFLSIDVDGGDYYILKSLMCRPKVICIECGYAWHPLADKEITMEIALQDICQPNQLYLKQAKEMGYTPITFNVVNLFLVKNEYAHLFKETPKDMVTMFIDSWRTMPYKEMVLERRKRLFEPLEGKEINIEMPITLDL